MTYQEWLNLRDKSPFGVPFLERLADGEYFISVDFYQRDIHRPINSDGLLLVKKNQTYKIGNEWFCSDIILEEFFTKRVIQVHPKINLDHISYDSECGSNCNT